MSGLKRDSGWSKSVVAGGVVVGGNTIICVIRCVGTVLIEYNNCLSVSVVCLVIGRGEKEEGFGGAEGRYKQANMRQRFQLADRRGTMS